MIADKDYGIGIRTGEGISHQRFARRVLAVRAGILKAGTERRSDEGRMYGMPKTRIGLWIMQTKRVLRGQALVHCWQDGPDLWSKDYPGYSTTCMRSCGHLGKHKFVADSEIIVAFAPES